MKIYAASSWRNMLQPQIVETLRGAGHSVYDFRNPPKATGFAWSEIDLNWKGWDRVQYLQALGHMKAVEGFNSDMDAMEWADVGLLILGAGASAHLELGWFAGNPNKSSIILLQPDYIDDLAKEYLKQLGHTSTDRACPVCGDMDGCHLSGRSSLGIRRRMEATRMTPFEPELMYKMADYISTNMKMVLSILESMDIDATDHAP